MKKKQKWSLSDVTYRRFGVERRRQEVWVPAIRRVAPVVYCLEAGILDVAFPHTDGCRRREQLASMGDRVVIGCPCRLQPMVALPGSPEVFVELFPPVDTEPMALNYVNGALQAWDGLTPDEQEQIYEEASCPLHIPTHGWTVNEARLFPLDVDATVDADERRSAPLEVDYARDLDDAPTFTEALAALEAHKARRQGSRLSVRDSRRTVGRV